MPNLQESQLFFVFSLMEWKNHCKIEINKCFVFAIRVFCVLFWEYARGSLQLFILLIYCLPNMFKTWRLSEVKVIDLHYLIVYIKVSCFKHCYISFVHLLFTSSVLSHYYEDALFTICYISYQQFVFNYWHIPFH